MARGRKPTATAIKEANGSFKKNPQRRNKNEPKASGNVPIAPETVKADPVAFAWWNWTCELLNEIGLLTATDAHIIESYCMNESWLRRAASLVDELGMVIQSGKVVKSNPAAAEWNKCMDRRTKLQAEMGLTASARTRLQAGADTEVDDVISEFFKELGGGRN